MQSIEKRRQPLLRPVLLTKSAIPLSYCSRCCRVVIMFSHRLALMEFHHYVMLLIVANEQRMQMRGMVRRTSYRSVCTVTQVSFQVRVVRGKGKGVVIRVNRDRPSGLLYDVISTSASFRERAHRHRGPITGPFFSDMRGITVEYLLLPRDNEGRKKTWSRILHHHNNRTKIFTSITESLPSWIL